MFALTKLSCSVFRISYGFERRMGSFSFRFKKGRFGVVKSKLDLTVLHLRSGLYTSVELISSFAMKTALGTAQ